MRQFSLDIATESKCDCGAVVSVDAQLCPSCGAPAFCIQFDQFFSDMENGWILDARFGGLVLGRKTADDDIPMYSSIGGALFKFLGLMQGGEYILSRMASIKFGTTLEKLNAEKGEIDHAPILYPCRTSIDTNYLPPNGGLWINKGQFIVNRFATRNYIEELDQMNAEANEEYARDPSRL